MKKKSTPKSDPMQTALKSPLAQIRTIEVKGVGGKVKKIEKVGTFQI